MKPLVEYYYYYKGFFLLTVCNWVAYFYDREKYYTRGAGIAKACGGREHSGKSLFQWETLVQAGRNGNVISRALPYYIRKYRVGSPAPDGIIHRFTSLEEAKLSSFFKPGRMTVLNFGSYT